MMATHALDDLVMSPTNVDGYHSPEDTQRMQALIHSLVHERRHVCLAGDDAQRLEHYSRLLVRDLRRQPQVKVVGYNPSGTDQLLLQINELLADLSIDQVVDRQSAASVAVRVFVVHDSPELSIDELTLMVRLIKDLPGANLRIALIQAQDKLRTASLQALGSQAVHWKMGTADTSALQAREALDQKLQAALREAPEPDLQRSWRSTRRPLHEPVPVPRVNARAHAAWSTMRALLKPLAVAGSARRRLGLPPIAPWREWHRQPTDRRNRIILVAGLVTSAALAIGLGLWLSSRTPVPSSPAPGAAKPPSAAVPK